MKRVLVAGGAGFIGSHLCDQLLALGNEVLCVDNFYTGSRTNIQHLLLNPKFEILRHDICFPLYVEVDQIYNLACPASPVHYQKDPIQTCKTSVLGSINLLGMAKRLHIKYLLTSTSEVYGDPEIHPQPESYWGNVNPIGTRSCYDEGKRVAETLASDYRRSLGIDTKIVRIFNTYGPRMQVDDGRVVSNFVCQALNNDPITIYGDGSQTRSFCYVDDLVDGLIRLMGTGPEVGGPVNIGNPVEYSMSELSRIILDKTASKSHLVYNELPKDDPKRRKPVIDKARDLLGWEPTTPVAEGLDKTISYFKSHLGHANG